MILDENLLIFDVPVSHVYEAIDQQNVHMRTKDSWYR